MAFETSPTASDDDEKQTQHCLSEAGQRAFLMAGFASLCLCLLVPSALLLASATLEGSAARWTTDALWLSAGICFLVFAIVAKIFFGISTYHIPVVS